MSDELTMIEQWTQRTAGEAFQHLRAMGYDAPRAVGLARKLSLAIAAKAVAQGKPGQVLVSISPVDWRKVAIDGVPLLSGAAGSVSLTTQQLGETVASAVHNAGPRKSRITSKSVGNPDGSTTLEILKEPA